MRRRGEQALPEGFSDCPDIPLGYSLYWQAFHDLHHDRGSNGMIPWSAIRWWSEAHEFGPQEFDDLVILIRMMDHEFIKSKPKGDQP